MPPNWVYSNDKQQPSALAARIDEISLSGRPRTPRAQPRRFTAATPAKRETLRPLERDSRRQKSFNNLARELPRPVTTPRRRSQNPAATLHPELTVTLRKPLNEAWAHPGYLS